jgi:hypothetical protein
MKAFDSSPARILPMVWMQEDKQDKQGRRFSMSSISFSGTFAPPDAAESYANTAAAREAQPTANNTADTVQLSESQQVYQLHNQGQTVSQIATSLSLPIDLVNTYLGISGSKT